jgi:hypothetical protein
MNFENHLNFNYPRDISQMNSDATDDDGSVTENSPESEEDRIVRKCGFDRAYVLWLSDFSTSRLLHIIGLGSKGKVWGH